MTASKRERFFGVVVPAPPHLARLANRVRRFYDPNFSLIGPHVTVLPPRSLGLSRREVVTAVRNVAERSRSFSLRLGRIQTFLPVKPVIFAGLARGGRALSRLHERLAQGPLRRREVFPYVPHLTLAQDLQGERLIRALALSRRVFTPANAGIPWKVDSLVIVEQVSSRRWVALTPVPLAGLEDRGRSPSRRSRRN